MRDRNVGVGLKHRKDFHAAVLLADQDTARQDREISLRR